MKRKLALLLALVMVLSVVPMMSFAASENRVSRVGQIKEDGTFQTGNAPVLRIAEEDKDWGTEPQSIRLRLDGAEWDDKIAVTAGVYAGSDVNVTNIRKDSDTIVTVEFTPTGNGKDVLQIEMLAKVTDAEAKVTIDARDAAVTGGTYVFARSSDGNAIVTVADSVTFGSGTKKIETIEIDETSYNSYKGGKVKFKLPGGFEWDVSGVNYDFSGRFDDMKTVTTTDDQGNSTTTKVNPLVKVNDEEIEFDFSDIDTTASNTRGTIFIKDLAIKADSDAKFGDVNVRVTGKDIDSTSLLVAKYKDFGVIVKADGDAKEVVAGRLENSADDEAHELQKLVIKEDIKGSWLERTTKIEFPSWVKVRSIEVDTAKNFEDDYRDRLNSGAAFSYNKTRNEVEFTPEIQSDKKAELELIFYVSVEADATGDITALVSGRALDEEYEVKLGKAIAPIEVKTDVRDVKIGVQRQELGKITLEENVAGAFMKDELVRVELEDGFRWAKDPSVKVTDGEDDLKIDRIKTDKEVLTFRVTRESDKPATIEISDIQVDLYRTLPEGEFKVSIGGEALVKNTEEIYSTNTTDFEHSFKTEYVAEPVIARVVTPAPDAATGAKEVVLTIGSTTMFVDGVSETANAAPYIDSADRTMLPVSAIGRALGAKVEWNNAARTVLVTKGNDRVLLTIGKDTMNVNGMEIPMRSKAVITGERTFVPLKDLGVALGVGVEWDAATRTVTVK